MVAVLGQERAHVKVGLAELTQQIHVRPPHGRDPLQLIALQVGTVGAVVWAEVAPKICVHDHFGLARQIGGRRHRRIDHDHARLVLPLDRPDQNGRLALLSDLPALGGDEADASDVEHCADRAGADTLKPVAGNLRDGGRHDNCDRA